MINQSQWKEMLSVLNGEQPDKGVSIAAACRAAGALRSDFNKLLARSKEQRDGDEEWVLSVVAEYGSKDVERGGAIEDAAFGRAVNGWADPVFGAGGEQIGSRQKFDTTLTTRMLGKYNTDFREKRDVNVDQKITIGIEIDDMRDKLLSKRRMHEAEGRVIEGVITQKALPDALKVVKPEVEEF